MGIFFIHFFIIFLHCNLLSRLIYFSLYFIKLVIVTHWIVQYFFGDYLLYCAFLIVKLIIFFLLPKVGWYVFLHMLLFTWIAHNFYWEFFFLLSLVLHFGYSIVNLLSIFFFFTIQRYIIFYILYCKINKSSNMFYLI